MEARVNNVIRDAVKFNGNDISMAAKMVDTLTTTIDIIYYLMNRREERGFVLMLVTAQNIDTEALVQEQKRDTDILFEIDKEASLYAIICQDTKIDGAYHFAERVVRNMLVAKGEDVYCAELEVRTTVHDIKYVVFKLIETFIHAKQDKKQGEIIFKTLH